MATRLVKESVVYVTVNGKVYKQTTKLEELLDVCPVEYVDLTVEEPVDCIDLTSEETSTRPTSNADYYECPNTPDGGDGFQYFECLRCGQPSNNHVTEYCVEPSDNS